MSWLRCRPAARPCCTASREPPRPEIGLAPFLFSGDGALQGFNLYHEARHEAPSRGLARLLALVQARKLDTFVTHTASWTEVRAVAAEYMTRKYPGKVVLVVD